MKMKFFGQPNMLVKTRKKVWFEQNLVLKPLFRFDEKGEYVTDDEELIKKLTMRFDHCPVIEQINDDVFEPVIEMVPETIAFICKKCGEGFDGRGKFLTHSRKCGKDD